MRNRNRRRAIPLILILCGLGATAHWSRSDAPAADASARLEWGLYQILWSRDYGRHLSAEIDRFASKPDYVMFYRDLDRRFPKTPVDAVVEHGATPVVSMELWRWHDRGGGSYLPAICAGAFDDRFRRWARAAKADGRRVLLRFGFEFNGEWFSWSGEPKRYVAAWRRAHAIFKAEGATNVEWVWAPNLVSVPDTPENDMHLYYPGDAYVDWVGVDGYNFGDDHDEWHKWTSFEALFGAVLADLARRYPDKPLMLAEFGCAPGEADARRRWIREAYAYLRKACPRVEAVIWFNYDKRREGEPNWRIDATEGALAAFNETFAAPAHRSDGSGSTG